MTMEEVPEPSLANHQHLLDWLDDTISFIPSVPSFLDEPYSKIELKPYEWWDEAQNDKSPASSAGNAIHTTTAAAATPTTTYPTTLPKDEFIKKRKKPENHIIRSQQSRRRTNTHIEEDSVENQEDGGEAQRKLGRKAQTKESGSSSGGSNGSKEVRWAEQLLNPCARAIEAANIPRIQHLLYVLSEISSPSGDPNHRLASHGLRTLLRHLNSIGLAAAIPAGLVDGSSGGAASCFATTEPKLFRSALIKFQEVSPWFALPNSLANSCIHQILTIENKPKSLHIVDIGVSHGIQWPILLESLTRRPGGAPTLIRLTVAGSAAPSRPFSACPPGYDFPSHLLRYAKSISLNLSITQTKALSSTVRSPDEILVVSSQFRGLHGPLLRSIRDLEPDLVILTDLDGGSGVQGGGGFAEGFGRRAGLLWTFLESTSAAFKGRENAERRLVEGEAAGMLEVEMGEGREEWRERMKGLGFVEAEFGEEAVERGRTLLKKYDGNWEMRAPSPAMAAPTVEEEAAVSLAWKGRSVSFCSLWMVAGRTRQRR